MSPMSAQKTSNNSSTVLKISSKKLVNNGPSPVVNEGKKGFFGIFKSFLAVAGDFV